MKYDDLVEYLGELGPYQRRIYFLSCLPVMAASIQAFIPVFILAVPDHRCAVPGLSNDTYSTQSDQHQALINHTMVWTDTDADEDDDIWGSAQCKVLAGRNVDNFNPNNRSMSYGPQVGCTRWVYDTSVFDNSFVTQDNWVCDDKVFKSHANMIYMAGLLIGSMGFGSFSDWAGRKTAFCLAVLLNVVSAVAITWAPNFPVFAVLRWINGLGNIGIFTCCFVLGVELVGRGQRVVAGIAIQYFWAFGMFVLDLFAYLIRDWQILELSLSCYAAIFLLLWWIVPESPRWLISKGRIDEARVVMEDIAKANGKDLPKDAFDQPKDEEEQPKGKLLDIFSSRVLFFRIMVVFINWLVVTMVYYGLTLNVGSLGGDVYLNFFISGVMEVLACIATMYALPRWGRKKFHCFAMVLGGLGCLCSMIPAIIGKDAPDWVTLVLSNVGKFGATAGFATIYVLTAELFPTFMRNSVVGASSMVARVGGMVAPYIADLGIIVGGSFGAALPYIIFGASALLAGLLALTLPETLDRKLPETINDAINFGKDSESSDIFKEKPMYGMTEKDKKVDTFHDIGHDNQAYSERL